MTRKPDRACQSYNWTGTAQTNSPPAVTQCCVCALLHWGQVGASDSWEGIHFGDISERLKPDALVYFLPEALNLQRMGALAQVDIDMDMIFD